MRCVRARDRVCVCASVTTLAEGAGGDRFSSGSRDVRLSWRPQVASRTCGGGNGGCKLVSSELWVLRPRHLALFMATHNRLGSDPKCWLSNLVFLFASHPCLTPSLCII
jgi:hypothetical protein